MHPSELFKFLHILAVVTALGANLTYAYWLGRAGRDRQQLVFVIESVRRLDRRIANPAYIVAAIAGVGLVVTGGYSFSSSWLVTAIGIYALIAIAGITIYRPAMRTQLALARSAPESDAYGVAARRSRVVGIVVTVGVLAIMGLMVVKPTLWS